MGHQSPSHSPQHIRTTHHNPCHRPVQADPPSKSAPPRACSPARLQMHRRPTPRPVQWPHIGGLGQRGKAPTRRAQRDRGTVASVQAAPYIAGHIHRARRPGGGVSRVRGRAQRWPWGCLCPRATVQLLHHRCLSFPDPSAAGDPPAGRGGCRGGWARSRWDLERPLRN